MARSRTPGYLPDAVAAAPAGQSAEIKLTTSDGQLSVRNIGSVGIGETMLVPEQHHDRNSTPSRLADAVLTPREGEVQSWLAKGKTNRDIGDILGTSHRTINKHLEHVFEKLGVETGLRQQHWRPSKSAERNRLQTCVQPKA